MNKKEITKDLINAFYNAKASKKLQISFQQWFMKNQNTKEQNKTLYDLWNQTENLLDAALLEKELREVNQHIDMISVKKQKRLTYWLKIAAVVILPLFVAGITFSLVKNKYTVETVMNQEYVGRGEIKQIVLADGTEVWINSESTLIYPETFDKNKRVVYLIGEANFQVTKSEQIPFIVQTSQMNIEVLGTKFNVEAYPNGTEVKTTLEEGKVLVNINDEHNNSFLLSPSEQIALNVKTGSINKQIVDVETTNAWSRGTFAFSGASLEYVFQQMERKFDIRINYSLDSYHNNQRLTIRFDESDSIEDIFNVLQNMVPGLNIKINKDEIEIN